MKNWKKYLVEIVLIVLGINIGLYFNNLNADRQELQLEQKLLQELKNDLKQDLFDVSGNIEIHKAAVMNCENALNFIQKSEPYQDLDSILVHIRKSFGWSFLISKSSTYESLKSIGFQIIRDDSIRTQLTDLHNIDYKYIAEFEELNQQRRKELEKLLIDFSILVFQYKFQKKKEGILEKTKELEFRLYALRSSNWNLANSYTQRVKPRLEKINRLIDNYLKN